MGGLSSWFGSTSGSAPMFSGTEGSGWTDVFVNGEPTSVYTGSDTGMPWTAAGGTGSGLLGSLGGMLGGGSGSSNPQMAKFLMGMGMNMLQNNQTSPNPHGSIGSSALNSFGKANHSTGSGAADTLALGSTADSLDQARRSARGENAPTPDTNRFAPFVPSVTAPQITYPQATDYGSYSPLLDSLTLQDQFGQGMNGPSSLLGPRSSSLLGG